MPRTVTFRPEVENWIQSEAERIGTTPEAVIVRVLETQWAVAHRVSSSTQEDELLKKASEGMPEAFWNRFHPLRQKLDEETLTHAEQQEFLELNAQLEAKNAERMDHLLELARLRGMSLPDIMKQLGIGSIQMPATKP
ncbi:MAG: hypothetical protein OHK0029_22800 [Armatimonadaceae bacterium]